MQQLKIFKTNPRRVPSWVLFEFTQIKNPATLCIYWVFFFIAGGDEMRHIKDYQHSRWFTKNPPKPLYTGTFYLPRVTKVH